MTSALRGPGGLFLLGYVATIFAANWSIQNLGTCTGQGPCTLPVWPGIDAPSGVLWAGLAFSFRDLVQEYLGRVATIVAIVVGAALSALLALMSPPMEVALRIATASGLAFLVSELADLAVYTPLRRRNWLGAVAASNVVGFVADSALFLLLAFGSLDFLTGQLIGKGWMTALAIALLWFLRRRHPTQAPGPA